MNCCSNGADGIATPVSLPRRWLGLAWAAAQWSLPVVALALMPKCPGCVAAYVLLLTGAGISIAAASMLQTAVAWGCGLALVLLGARLLWKLRGRHASAGVEPLDPAAPTASHG